MRWTSPALLAATAAVAVASCGGSDHASDRPDPHSKPQDTRLVAFDGGGPLVGLADNRPETFDDLRFQATGIDRVRVVVPYDDVLTPGARRRAQDYYFQQARKHRKEVLVSFYRSYRHPRSLPSPAAFRTAFRRFRSRHPEVHRFSAWSEPNTRVQPTYRAPERAAAYYQVLRDECTRGRCTVTTGDFRLDASRASARWLKRFRRAVGPGEHIWGLSAFEDADRRSTALTRRFLARTRGPVWVAETGAVLKNARSPRPNPGAQRRRMAFLVSRYPRVSKRIERMYIYDWHSAGPTEPFDSALLDLRGNPRPAYWEFARGIGRLVF